MVKIGDWAFIIVFMVLLVLGILGTLRMWDRQTSAQDAVLNAERAEQLAIQIRQLRELEAIAASEAIEDGDDLGKELLVVAKENGIQEKLIVAIRPIPPTQIEDTDYQRHDVSMKVTKIAMPDLIAFLLDCENQSALQPTSLALSAGQRVAGKELWTADVGFTRLVYSAATKR